VRLVSSTNLKRTSAGGEAMAITLLIGFMLSISLGGYVTGAMLGFSLIENRDENTLVSIAVTPASVKGYTLFKFAYYFIFSFIGNLIMVGGLKYLLVSLMLLSTVSKQYHYSIIFRTFKSRYFR